MNKLFVYGTLKHNYHNHRYLRGAEYIDLAYLYDYGIFSLGGFPGIAPATGLEPVSGELYDVPDETWPILDRLEGVNYEYPNDGMYRKILAEVYDAEGGKHDAFVYVYNGTPGTFIPSGEWQR